MTVPCGCVGEEPSNNHQIDVNACACAESDVNSGPVSPVQALIMAAATAETSYTIFVGNPGTGKSTLLNGLANEVIFESGISYVSGLTQVLQIHSIGEGKFIGDTPGLSDATMRKQAATEIEKALKQNGKYRLVFVVKLDSGRVRPDDMYVAPGHPFCKRFCF